MYTNKIVFVLNQVKTALSVTTLQYIFMIVKKVSAVLTDVFTYDLFYHFHFHHKPLKKTLSEKQQYCDSVFSINKYTCKYQMN